MITVSFSLLFLDRKCHKNEGCASTMHSTCLINYWNCCKLISHGSTTYYLHTIDAPNQVGQACEFSPERLELPTNLPHHLPNIPQYRYITGCDFTIVLPEIVTFTE